MFIRVYTARGPEEPTAVGSAETLDNLLRGLHCTSAGAWSRTSIICQKQKFNPTNISSSDHEVRPINGLFQSHVSVHLLIGL